jgi:hypothetical protein
MPSASSVSGSPVGEGLEFGDEFVDPGPGFRYGVDAFLDYPS